MRGCREIRGRGKQTIEWRSHHETSRTTGIRFLEFPLQLQVVGGHWGDNQHKIVKGWYHYGSSSHRLEWLRLKGDLEITTNLHQQYGRSEGCLTSWQGITTQRQKNHPSRTGADIASLKSGVRRNKLFALLNDIDTSHGELARNMTSNPPITGNAK